MAKRDAKRDTLCIASAPQLFIIIIIPLKYNYIILHYGIEYACTDIVVHLGQFTQKWSHKYFIKCHTNASRLNMDKAINFLFSTHHTKPFLDVKIYFAVLH